MSNNGWPGKLGVPLNPERDGWHWLLAMYYDDPIGPPISCFWYAEHQSWPRLQDKPGNQPVSRGFCYLGPAFTPAEVDARIKEAEAKIAAGCLISNAAEVADLVLLNPDRWRGAINDALTNWLSTIEDHETPKDALQRLIRLEVMAALDPAVSQSAVDLVAKARRDALEEAARVVEGMSKVFHPSQVITDRCAAAIRALGEKE